jgi:serine/threonine-protein kinase
MFRTSFQRWITCFAAIAAAVFAVETDAAPDTSGVATRAKEVLRTHCLECHGGKATSAGIAILDRQSLLDEEAITPGEPDDSLLFQLITSEDESGMPPPGRPRLGADDVNRIRDWIIAGAPDFPADATLPSVNTPKETIGPAGDEYVLGQILTHVRTLKPADRRFVRYLSIHHLHIGGATPAELDLHRAALAKVINHLSWESAIVAPEPIDAPANTVFAIDLRRLGWQLTPFEAFDGGLSIGPSSANLYDLALLEYPYAIVSEGLDAFDRVVEEYMASADMISPIPFVRADWFISVLTQPQLYADFLQLPPTLAELEKKLEVDSAANIKNGVAKRAGMTHSGVSRNNRVVERHPSRYGYYWKSFDFKSNRGLENVFGDPINFVESGGEMLFSLPNGLNGYYICDSKKARLDFAPTEIVVDKFASDRVVRNGLSCIRCHDAGIKGFVDAVRPALLKLPGTAKFGKQQALDLYPEHAAMEVLVNSDAEQFTSALAKAVGGRQQEEPVAFVSRRYLDDSVTLAAVAGELGHASSTELQAVFRAPAFASLGLLPLTGEGVVRRDAWEENFDQAVRALGLGQTVLPLDGTTRRDFTAVKGPVDVELTTNKSNNVFEQGDELTITVTNRSDRPLFVELVGTSARGKMVVLVNSKTQVAPGGSLVFPDAASPPIRIRGGAGKEQITLFASDAEFSSGQVLRGKDVSDRFVHRFQSLEKRDGRTIVAGDPGRIVKRTLDIETR